jgi:CubicO group peptidase (beta-lactamase class C family)
VDRNVARPAAEVSPTCAPTALLHLNHKNITMPIDFSAAHAVLRSAIEQQHIHGAACMVAVHGEVVDQFTIGLADVATGKPFAEDTICRAFSNTKLASTALVLKFVDQGLLGLDDPVKRWIPGFASVRVLRAGAQHLEDTVPLEADITVRHLLSHQAGLVHAVFDPEAMLYKSYRAAGIRGNDTNLAEMVDLIVQQPLAYQPGRGWEYGLGLDVLARVVEIVTGLDWPTALQRHLLDPLNMVDTGHLVRAGQSHRLATLYMASDPFKPKLPADQVAIDLPWPQANLVPVRRTAGGGGTVTTLGDWMKLLLALQPGTGTYLRPETQREMFRDQLPAGSNLRFAHLGELHALGFGLGGCITRRATAMQPSTPVGEMQWGGLGCTHWAMDPSRGISIVHLSQRHFGFWHPFWFDYKTRVYEALS